MPDPTDILNFRREDDSLTLSGQPTEAQLEEIKALGVTHVINLGPHDNKGALPDEAGSVAALGMEYIYISVDFAAPRGSDYDAFCAAMTRLERQKVHVHCIYNARVTAFMYRYAKDGFRQSVAEAFALMDDVWRPGGDWADFIREPSAKGRPNRYKGYEY